MLLFYSVFESVLYLSCTAMIQCIFFDCTIKRKPFFIVNSILYIAFISLAFFDIKYHIFSVIIILLNFINLKICLKYAKIRNIVITYLFLYSINICLVSIFVFILGKSDNILLTDFISFIISVVTLTLCMFICIIRKEDLCSYYKLIPSRVKKIVFVSIVSSCFVVTSFSESNTFENVVGWTTGTRIALLFFILFIGAVIPVLIFTSIGSSLNLNKSKELEKRIEAQQNHYSDLSVAIKDFRLFRHDYDNKLISVRQAIVNGDSDAALRRLDQSNEEMNLIIKNKIQFDTGSGPMDAVLSVKQRMAEKVNAKIEFEGGISIDEKYISTGLTVLLGNALDNAIEACEKITGEDTKIIKVSCDCRGTYMFLKITNPVAEDIKIRNNKLPPTTKEDKKNHGIGMQSMLNVVRKYNGTLNISCENKTFCLEVDLDVMDYEEKKKSWLDL